MKMFAAIAKGFKTYHIPLATAELPEDDVDDIDIGQALANTIRTKLEIRDGEMSLKDLHRVMPKNVEKSKVSEALDSLLQTKVVEIEGDIVRLC